RVANGAPAYSCLIECTTGTLYVGTAEGVFTSTSATGTWSAYGDFDGVPVTAMRQQTKALPKASYLGHTGISEEHYLFAKTKYPNALYFGTYGRGIFMDMKYVTDTLNEVSDSTDWVGIQTVNNGLNSIQVYPNPASDYATIDIAVAQEGNAVIRVYDLSGKLVFTENLGRVSEGQYTYRLNCQNFRHGMYLINMNIGSKSATSKLVVK
ncbi:MAG: T9SS type A sorting domain-containing protein, partial [Bacteroidales bacterium]|nr:T9SS type A sorting domain-containing protein [Bacteroidales bacterium]